LQTIKASILAIRLLIVDQQYSNLLLSPTNSSPTRHYRERVLTLFAVNNLLT